MCWRNRKWSKMDLRRESEWLLRFHSCSFSLSFGFAWFSCCLSFADGSKALIHASPGADRICDCLPVFSLCRFAFSSNSQRFAAFLRHFVFLLHNPHNHGFSLLTHFLTVICPFFIWFILALYGAVCLVVAAVLDVICNLVVVVVVDWVKFVSFFLLTLAVAEKAIDLTRVG